MQIAAASASSGRLARGSTRASAVAAASEEVACAEGKESLLGALASAGCSVITGRWRPTSLDREVDDDRRRGDERRGEPARAPRRIGGGGARPDRDPDRPVLAAQPERLHRRLGRRRVRARAQQPQQRLVERAEGAGVTGGARLPDRAAAAFLASQAAEHRRRISSGRRAALKAPYG